ncbi:unnamed protein product [Discula destructiva]
MAMDQVTLRQRVRNNYGLDVSPPLAKSITFRHPGYSLDNILFTLPRLDQSPQVEEAAAAGVHHGTALLACQIIANNAFDGFLTTDQEGKNRVPPTVPLDGVLLDDDYWFHTADRGDDTDIYPVVPRFEEWQFPHGYMGHLTWDPKIQAFEPEQPLTSESKPLTSAPDRRIPITSAMFSSNPFAPPPSRRCILSNNGYATQQAHIVPTAQSFWFQINNMKRYGDSRQFIHAAQNRLPLRHDLHKLWDDFVYTLVPKRGGCNFVVHVLGVPSSAASEFAHEWHNTPVQEGALDGVAKAFLFAKFAQAVFMLFKPFVAFAAERRLIATFQTKADDDPLETTTAWVSASTLSRQYSGGGSRSASTSATGNRKRSQSQISGAGDVRARKTRPKLWASVLAEEEEEDDWYERDTKERCCQSSNDPGEDSDDDDVDWFEKNLAGRQFDEFGEEERGRPRKRQQRRNRSEHTVDTLPSLTDTSAPGDLEDDVMGNIRIPTPSTLSTHTSKRMAAEDDDTSFAHVP